MLNRQLRTKTLTKKELLLKSEIDKKTVIQGNRRYKAKAKKEPR